MRIELEHRRRLHEVKGATVKPLAANAYEVCLPRDDEAVQRSRRPWTVEGWDGAVLVLDGKDAEPAVASGIDPRKVRLTVFVM
jgi:hypothetical protein